MITKVWEESENGVPRTYAKDDDGRVGVVNVGWDKGCGRCEAYMDEIKDISKDDGGWEGACEFALNKLVFVGAEYLCRNCYLEDGNRYSGVIEHLLDSIETTSAWRRGKAEEYPDDADRNLSAANALDQLHEHIKQLPADHEMFRLSYACVDMGLDLDDAIREENNLIRIHGFQASDDPQEFVEDLIQIYQDAIANAEE